MKKYFIISIICLNVIFVMIGCGGGSKKKDDPPAIPQEPTLSASAKNLIPNGDFENEIAGNVEPDWGNWICGYTNLDKERTDTFERITEPASNNCLYFTAADCGEVQWEYLIIPFKKDEEYNFKFNSDKHYFISLKAKSDKPGGKIHVTLNDAEKLENYYGGFIITTTTEFQEYTQYISPGNGKVVRFALSMGNSEAKLTGGVVQRTNDGVKFYIDDVKFLEQE